MKLSYKIIIVIVGAAGAFAAGRWTLPEKIKTETKIVEVEKKTTEKSKNVQKRKKKITKTIVKSDGSKEITEEETEDTDTKTDVKKITEKEKDTEKSKEVVNSTSKITISALAGYDFTNTKVVFGASITRPILGPLTFGIFGLTNLSFGGSIGLTF